MSITNQVSSTGRAMLRAVPVAERVAPPPAAFRLGDAGVPLQAHGFMTPVGSVLDRAGTPMPSWLFDEATAHSHIRAKRFDDVGHRNWRRVIRVARLTRGLTQPHQGDASDALVSLTEARRIIADLLDALPTPPPRASCLENPRASDCAESAWPGEIDGAVHDLCLALTDPDWVDPVAIAGLVADLARAVDDYLTRSREGIRGRPARSTNLVVVHGRSP